MFAYILIVASALAQTVAGVNSSPCSGPVLDANRFGMFKVEVPDAECIGTLGYVEFWNHGTTCVVAEIGGLPYEQITNVDAFGYNLTTNVNGVQKTCFPPGKTFGHVPAGGIPSTTSVGGRGYDVPGRINWRDGQLITVNGVVMRSMAPVSVNMETGDISSAPAALTMICDPIQYDVNKLLPDPDTGIPTIHFGTSYNGLCHR